MNEHLTTDEIIGLVAETSNKPSLEQHARECATCGAELTQLRETMLQFRETVIVAGSQADLHGPISVQSPAAPPASFRLPAWPLTALLAGLAVLLPFFTVTTGTNQTPESQPSAAPVIDDEMLLHTVEAHLSRQVPSAFAPMMELMIIDWADDGQNYPSEEK